MSGAGYGSDRVTAQIWRLSPDEVGEGGGSEDGEEPLINFTYQFPYVDTQQESRTTEHKPIGEDPVVQHLGAGARQITVKGSCYLDEANAIDDLPTEALIEFQSHRWSGDAIVKRTSTSTTGEGGGRISGVENRVFEYRLELAEITGQNPLLESDTFTGGE